MKHVNPIQDEEGEGQQKCPTTSFSSITSGNLGISHQIVLTFRLNPFATLVQNLTFVPSASLKLLNLNQDHLSKKRFCLSNPYKIEFVINLFIEVRQLPNFCHMNTSTI